MSRVLDSVTDIPGFITPDAGPVWFEQGKLLAEQANIWNSCRQLLERRIKMNPRPVSVASETSDLTLTDMSDDKKSP